MLRLTIPYFLILVFIIITSCGRPGSNKEQAMAFLRRIDSVYSSIDEKGDLFDVYNQELAKIFSRNNRHPLAKQQIDSISFLFDDYMTTIDLGEQKMRRMSEFDTAFGIVRMNILFLQNQRMFWKNWVPKVISLYRLGWENLNDSGKMEMIQSTKLVRESQANTNKLTDNLFLINQRFARKYGFNYVPRNSK